MTTQKFLNRPYAYVIGVCLLPLALIVYLIGLVSPYWSTTMEGETTVIRGLWTTCDKESAHTLSNCRNRIDNAEDWVRGVQFLQCMGLLLLTVACVVAVIINVTPRFFESRAVELIGGLGVICGTFGVYLYVARTGIPFDDTFPVSFSWGFGLDLAGCILAFIAIILVVVSNWPRGRTRDEEPKRGFLFVKKKMEEKRLQSYRPQKTAIVDTSLVLVPQPYVISVA